MRFRVVPAALVALVALVALGGVRAERRGMSQALGTDYRAIVDAYRRGASDATAQVAAASASDTQAWMDAAVSGAVRDWDWPTVRAAAVLHTELWYRALVDRREDDAGRQLDVALRLLIRVGQSEPLQIEFIDRWQTFVITVLRVARKPRDIDAFVLRTKDRFPVPVARQEATHDVSAGLRAERAASDRAPALTPDVWRARLNAEQASAQPWIDAALAYADALRRDPSLEIAALHLGRIRMLQGDLQEAATLFVRAAAGDDPRVRYLSALFAGSLAERQGDFAGAEQRYRRAMEAYPSGQAAWLALSQLFSRTGRDTQARAVLAALTARPGAVVEPLWTYLPPAAPQMFDALLWLDELRAEVLR